MSDTKLKVSLEDALASLGKSILLGGKAAEVEFLSWFGDHSEAKLKMQSSKDPLVAKPVSQDAAAAADKALTKTSAAQPNAQPANEAQSIQPKKS